MSVSDAAQGIERSADSAGQPGPPCVCVTALSTTPVKGLHVHARRELSLQPGGVAENRCFYLIDERARLVNGKRIGSLTAVLADYEAEAERLTMRFPDDSVADGAVALGEPIQTRFFSRTPTARLVVGPWSEALSSYVGQPLRLVRADEDGGVDRGPRGAVSLISRASVERLERLAGETVDPRRFRMLIEVAGSYPHQEDDWVGHRLRVGEALVAMHGHVGRCLVTTQSPDTGVVDLPTLDLLSYRRGLATTEPLAFGVYGEVLEPGLVRLGDRVTPD